MSKSSSTQGPAPGRAPIDARSLKEALDPYREPSPARSIFEIAVTALPLALTAFLAWLAIENGFWWGLALVVPTAGFLVRLFIIQHDCGHGAFFRHRLANDWVGRVISVLTFTPYDVWRQTHAIHHATSGNLDQRGIGDVITLTVDEYLARSWWGRLRYRVYRNPIVLFVIGPAALFLIGYRVPVGLTDGGWRPWASAMATNLGILALVLALIVTLGLNAVLIYLATALVAGSIGVWLFYVQHQFEETIWRDGPSWNFHEAALHGSSHYDLPAVLRWFTGNIGIHHIHHLSSRIPFYRLPEVLAQRPDIQASGRLTLLQSLRCVKFDLWDKSAQRLVSFRQLHAAGMKLAG